MKKHIKSLSSKKIIVDIVNHVEDKTRSYYVNFNENKLALSTE